MTIISGGQTGIDRMALEVARELGFVTGGTAPKDFMTEAGPDPSLKDFGLVEHFSRSYGPRTLINVRDSDGTVLFGDMNSIGSYKTIQHCVACGKPYIVNPASQALVQFILRHQIGTLNVAGNRGSKLPLHQLDTYRRMFREALRSL